MSELEKLKHAKFYIEQLANGINPLTNQLVPDTDVINNVSISRCLFYICGVLDNVLEDIQTNQKGKQKKTCFQIDYPTLTRFEFSTVPIPITEIVRRINALVDTERMHKLSYRNVTDWLIEIDLLKVISTQEGKAVKRPTQTGREIGIDTEQRQGQHGMYSVVTYNRNAQQFIIDNLHTMIASTN